MRPSSTGPLGSRGRLGAREGSLLGGWTHWCWPPLDHASEYVSASTPCQGLRWCEEVVCIKTGPCPRGVHGLTADRDRSPTQTRWARFPRGGHQCHDITDAAASPDINPQLPILACRSPPKFPCLSRPSHPIICTPHYLALLAPAFPPVGPILGHAESGQHVPLSLPNWLPLFLLQTPAQTLYLQEVSSQDPHPRLSLFCRD